MTRKQKKMLVRIIVGAAALLAAFLVSNFALPDVAIPESRYIAIVSMLLYLIPYLLVGYDVLIRASKNIAHGQVFDENFLMCIATVGAFITGEYPEAVFVMLFYQVGELFQTYAVGKSRRSIAALMDIRPDHAVVRRGGEELVVPPEEVAIGDIIVVKPGERVPLDGVVTDGRSSLNTSALTGESAPRDVCEGDSIISGCINVSGVICVRVEREYGESTVAKILDLVENSGANKSKSENFITRFASWYTPAVVIGAVALAVVPSLVNGEWMTNLHRALTFLVISCPCALVISVPLSYFGGVGGASSNGILVKGTNYLEALSKCDTVVFDKTGTLTKGTFCVSAVHPDEISKEELLRITAMAECYSDHPIAQSLRGAYRREIDKSLVTGVREIAGRGISANVEGRIVCAGNQKLMEDVGAAWHECHHAGTIVHVACDGRYAGHIVISDEIKESSAAAIRSMHECGIRRTVMLTGDREAVGRSVAEALGIDEYHAELLPGDKVSLVEKMLAEKARGLLAFVGDGINDAPVLARSDIGIAMGALGSDAAIEAADVVLMDDDPMKIVSSIKISRRTNAIAKQNIVFALTIKALVLLLGAVGMATMWEAVFADVGVSVLAILNAMRTLNTKKKY